MIDAREDFRRKTMSPYSISGLGENPMDRFLIEEESRRANHPVNAMTDQDMINSQWGKKYGTTDVLMFITPSIPGEERGWRINELDSRGPICHRILPIAAVREIIVDERWLPAPDGSIELMQGGGLGEAPRIPGKFKNSDEEIAQWIVAYQGGASASSIARSYGVNRDTVVQHLKRAGVSIRIPTGVARKVTDEIADLWAEQYSAGQTAASIAKDWGVTTPTVSKYLRRLGIKVGRGK
jgi:DNA-binding CsgD family transcriptional regulator